MPACDKIETDPMTLDQFMRWFHDNIKVRIHDRHSEKISPVFGD